LRKTSCYVSGSWLVGHLFFPCFFPPFMQFSCHFLFDAIALTKEMKKGESPHL